ncbi:MAG: molybdate ABC transporter permease subunit [Alphaproteobacteria bacterium]|nr:molybdate ABC transporter permease subunit [Alphaproteobacteria bacterium]
MFSPEEWTAILLSLKVAAAATLGLLPVGTALAWLLARREFIGKPVVNLLIHLPLVLPPVVTGYALLIVLGRKGPIGGLLETCCGLVFSFRWTGAALAAAVMGLPLMVRAVKLTIENINPQIEKSAASLGASPLRVFRSVTLPLAAPGILAGAILAFAKALGEFGATITFVSNIPGETQTLPLAIYGFTQVPGGDANALRLAAVSVAISFLALIASEIMARRLAIRSIGYQ